VADQHDLNQAMAELRRQYMAQLPAKMALIAEQTALLEQAGPAGMELDALRRMLHGLTGSAGTFGMHSLGDAARRAEVRLDRLRNADPTADTETLRIELIADLQHLDKLGHSAPQLHAPSLELPPSSATQLPQAEPLVFLVEDEPEQGEQLSRQLQEAGYRVQLFNRLQSFSQAMQSSETPAVVIMDMIFPEGELAGAEYIHGLKQQYQGIFPPVLFLSVRRDLEARLTAYRSGSAYYLNKPVDAQRLLRQLDELSLRVPKIPYQVLMVDDDPMVLGAQATLLRAAGMEVTTLSDPRKTLEQIEVLRPEVLILDFHMPEITGPELAALLREDERYHQLPILFLSSEEDENWQQQALNLGGDDFLLKPVNPKLLISRVSARARRSRESRGNQLQMQQLLYEREREHLALNQHAIVSIADRAGNITYVNDLFCEISGYGRDELLGNNHRMLKSGQHPDSYYQDLWATIASGEVWFGEVCNRRKDGSFYWVESSITPFLDHTGKPYQYVSIRTDITHVKAAEQELADSAHRLTATLESTKDGILAVGAQGEVLFMNQQFRQMWNMPESVADSANDEPLLAYALSQLIDPQGFLDKVQTLYHSDQESHDLIELNDGRIFERHSRALPDGNTLSGRVWSFHDITNRIRAEQAAEQAKERLRRGQIYANIGTWEWNIVTGKLFWTERIAPLFGYPQGDLETTYDNFLAAVHPDDRQAVIDEISACIEHDTPYEVEHRVVWPDGTVRWLLERGAVQRDAAGKPQIMIGVVQDIDDRKRAELALVERERQLLEAQSLASLGNWSADLITGELVWSDEIYHIFGHQPGSFTPSVAAFHAAVHPDDRALVHDSENTAKETGRHDVIHRILRPDGSIRHVHELAQMHLDETGKPLRLTGTVQDVTDRIEAEQRLRQTEQRFSFAVEGAGDGIWDWDISSGRMLFSANYEPMLGYQHGELESSVNAWKSSVHPADLEHVQQQLIDYIEGRNTQYNLELRLRCKDGNYKWILCRGTVVERNEHGEPMRLIGIHSDISQRKQAEQDLLIFRRVFDTTQQGIGVTDADGYLLYSNPAHDLLHGCEHQQCLGMHFTQFFSPETMSWAPEAIMANLLQNKSWAGLLPILREDGEEVITTSNIGVITGEDGKPQYLFNIMSDYSPELARQQELEEARLVAERANQAKSEFLSSMSHELRTPMNAILGFSQLMEYDDTLQEAHQDSVKEILKAGNHLLELINEVLDLAKVESGMIDLSLEPVELCPVVEECLSLVSTLADQRNIRITHSGLEEAAVRADRTRLKQVLLNLLSNAIKYNRDAGSVRIEMQPHDSDRLRVIVSDTGKGIPADKLTELFEPFNRLDAEGSEIEGTGIGLTITRRIVEMMGGNMDVHSEVGVGSSFWIELPLEHALDNSYTPKVTRQISSETGSDATESHLVLYIEDNPANIKLVTQILGHVPNIHLITAHTPDLGIELALVRQPELILLDINMPGMDGYQVLEVFQAEASLKNTPVVAITANAMPRDIERGIAAGFVDYLTKPINVEQFLETVRNRILHKEN